MDNPVVVSECELRLAELDVPFDAIEQFLERLHVSSFRCWCIQSGSRHAADGDSSPMKETANLPGEFELIARYFAPLASGFPDAFVPLLTAARAVFATHSGHIITVLTGGDDYEILFTAPPEAAVNWRKCLGCSTCRSPALAACSRLRPGCEIRSRFWTSPGSLSSSIAVGWTHF